MKSSTLAMTYKQREEHHDHAVIVDKNNLRGFDMNRGIGEIQLGAH